MNPPCGAYFGEGGGDLFKRQGFFSLPSSWLFATREVYQTVSTGYFMQSI